MHHSTKKFPYEFLLKKIKGVFHLEEKSPSNHSITFKGYLNHF